MKANDQYAQLKPGEVRIVRTLPGPIERVWEFLTDPEKRSRWFAGGPMEPRVGGKVVLHFRHANIAPDETPPEPLKEYHDPGNTIEGKVTRWEPPRALAYTFGWSGQSVVTFELTPQGKEVLLVLSHRVAGEDLQYVAGFAGGWHTHLAQLIAILADAPRPPFWPMHQELRAAYAKMLSSS